MARGGTRPGAGSPKRGNPSTQVVSIRIPTEELETIDRLARRSNLTRQQWVLREIHRALQKTRPR